MKKYAINLLGLILALMLTAVCNVSVNAEEDCIYGYGFDNGLNDYSYAAGSTEKGGASIVCVDATECMRLSCGSSVDGDKRFVRVIKHIDTGEEFSFSADILAKEYRTQNFAMLFCYEDNNNYYELCWSQEKIPSFWDVGHNKRLYLSKYSDGVRRTLGECAYNTVDLWRNYKIEFSRGKIAVSVDGEALISYYDNTPLKSKNIGFETYTDSYCAAEVIIDNVLIKNTDAAAHKVLENIAEHSVFMAVKSPWLITPDGRCANDPYNLTVTPLYKGEEVYIPFDRLAEHSFKTVKKNGDILRLDALDLNLKTGEYTKGGVTQKLTFAPTIYKNNIFLNVYDAARLMRKNIVVKNDIIVFSDVNMNAYEIPLQMIEALHGKNEDDGNASTSENNSTEDDWQYSSETTYSVVNVTDDTIDITVGKNGESNAANGGNEIAEALTFEEYQDYTAKFKIKLSPEVNEGDALTEYCGIYLSYTDKDNFLALEWSRRLEQDQPRIALVQNGYETGNALVMLSPDELDGIDVHKWSDIKIEKKDGYINAYVGWSNTPFLTHYVGDTKGKFGFFNRSMWGMNSTLSISQVYLTKEGTSIEESWEWSEETEYSSVKVNNGQIDITVGKNGETNASNGGNEIAKALSLDEYQNYTAKFKIRLSPEVNEGDALTEYCGIYLSYTDENNFLALEWSRRLDYIYPRIALVKNGYEKENALIILPSDEWGGLNIHEWSDIKIEKNENIVKVYALNSNVPFLTYEVGRSKGRFGFFNRSMWGKNSVLSVSDIVLKENTEDADKVSAIIYSDAFDDNSKLADYKVEEGSIVIENGTLKTLGSTKTNFSIGTADWGKYDFSADITSNGEYTVSYMKGAFSSGCSMTAKTNGNLVFEVNGIAIDEISPNESDFIPKGTNHISFERAGNRINVLVNGTPCFKYIDRFGIIKNGCVSFETLSESINIDNVAFRANISQETTMYAFADGKDGNIDVTMSVYPFADESEISGKLIAAAYQKDKLMGVKQINFTTEPGKMSSQLRVKFDNLIPNQLCEVRFFIWDGFANLRPLLAHKIKKVYNYTSKVEITESDLTHLALEDDFSSGGIDSEKWIASVSNNKYGSITVENGAAKVSFIRPKGTTFMGGFQTAQLLTNKNLGENYKVSFDMAINDHCDTGNADDYSLEYGGFYPVYSSDDAFYAFEWSRRLYAYPRLALVKNSYDSVHGDLIGANDYDTAANENKWVRGINKHYEIVVLGDDITIRINNVGSDTVYTFNYKDTDMILSDGKFGVFMFSAYSAGIDLTLDNVKVYTVAP